MANKNNSRSPKGRCFLTLRLRVIVNLTILETKKKKKKKNKKISYCVSGKQRPRSTYGDLGLCYPHSNKRSRQSSPFRYFETV